MLLEVLIFGLRFYLAGSLSSIDACYGLNCAPPPTYLLNPPPHVTVFGDGAFH